MCGGVAQAIDALARVDIDGQSAAELGQEILALLRQHARLDSQINRRLGRFDQQRGYEESGALDTVAWLRVNARLYGGAAADRVKVARAALDLPATTAAMQAGDISQSHAAVIARTAEIAGAEVSRELEPLLLEAAGQADPGRLHRFAKLQLGALRPTTLLDDAERLYAMRYLRCGRMENGCFYLDGILDPEGGVTLETALNAVMGPRRRGDQRTEIQRRADAAADICRRFLDGSGANPGKVKSMRPHLIVAVELDALRQVKMAPPARLGTGEPIPHEALLRHMCDSVLSMVAMDSDGNPLAATRETRSIPPSVRRAIALRTTTCEVRDCDRPAEWCEGHHMKPVALGGKTSSANIRNICTRHHHMVHDSGWDLIRADDGTLGLVRRPPAGSTDPGG